MFEITSKSVLFFLHISSNVFRGKQKEDLQNGV